MQRNYHEGEIEDDCNHSLFAFVVFYILKNNIKRSVL